MALKLPRFQRTVALVGKDGLPSLAFHRWFDQYGASIEAAVSSLSDQVAAIAAAQAAAAAAQVSATAAQAAADDAAMVARVTNSYTAPTAVLSATDAGSSATITVAAHTRFYGDGTSVAVGGAVLTGRPYATAMYVYYDDPALTGGAVSYQTTTSPATAAQTGTRLTVGVITTPASGGGGTTGGGGNPPGSGNPIP